MVKVTCNHFAAFDRDFIFCGISAYKQRDVFLHRMAHICKVPGDACDKRLCNVQDGIVVKPDEIVFKDFGECLFPGRPNIHIFADRAIIPTPQS